MPEQDGDSTITQIQERQDLIEAEIHAIKDSKLREQAELDRALIADFVRFKEALAQCTGEGHVDDELKACVVQRWMAPAEDLAEPRT